MVPAPMFQLKRLASMGEEHEEQVRYRTSPLTGSSGASATSRAVFFRKADRVRFSAVSRV